MSNQNSYTDVKNGPEEVGEENSKGSSDSFQVAMNNMWALISLHGKTNVQDDESETSKKFSGNSHSVSDSSPQLPKELPSRNKVHSEFPPQDKAHANKAYSELPSRNKAYYELPSQNKTYPEPIPQTDSSSVVAKPQENNSTANTPSASIVKNDDNREGWGWWAAKGLISGGGWAAKVAWSLFAVGLSGAWSVTKGAVEIFSLLSKEMQFAIVAAGYSMYKVKAWQEKAKNFLVPLFGQGKVVAKAIGKKLGVVAKATGGQIVDAAKAKGGQIVDAQGTVKEIAHQAKEGVINLLRGEFKVITLDGAKELIKEGKNDELQGYLIYENQITYDTQPEPQQTEIKIETEEKKLEEPEETAQEKNLEAPKGENLVQNMLHRQLLEEAIRCHNAGAVKLLLKHDKSVLKEIGGAVSGKFCNMIQDSGIQDREAKFQGVNIKGDQTLLPKAIRKLFDLRRSLSQLELSHSVVGTTKEVTLESIGQVEITFAPIDNDPYWMQANCVVNKKKNDEYSIVFFCKIARAGTQITNGESAQVNVLESDEFQKFLTKSINDYHDALNIIDCLLQQGADLKEMEEIAGLQYNIPLEEACYRNNRELFIVLLKNQATPSPALIKYTFAVKKPFYDLMSNPLCDGLWRHLWPKYVLDDAVQSENNPTEEPTVRLLLNNLQQTQKQPSNKTIFSEEEIYHAVLIYYLSQPTSNVTNINSSLGESLECISRAQLPAVNEKPEEIEAPNSTTSQPAMQPSSDGENVVATEEDICEEYHISNDSDAPQLPPATPPENKEISPPATDKVATQSQSADGQKLDGNSSPQGRTSQSTTRADQKLAATSSHPQLLSSSVQLTSAPQGQVVIYDSNIKAQVTKTLVKGNTYHPTSKYTSGMTPLTFNTSPSPGSPVDNQEIATTQKNSDNTKITTAQPLVVRQSQETRQEIAQLPEKVNNSPSTTSSQALSVFMGNPDAPKLDNTSYQNLPPQQRKIWDRGVATEMIQEFTKSNNILLEGEKLSIAVENLLKIMNNQEALLKLMNDILQQAQKSDSNHQNPFLTIMYGEKNALALSSNSQVLNVSPQSCMRVLTQCCTYISITDPLKYDYMTRGIKQQKDKDGNLVTIIRTPEQMKQEENQEIQKNNFEKNLILQLQDGTLDRVSDLFYLGKQKLQGGFSSDEMKYLVGGEKPLAIIRNLPFTCLQHSTQFFDLFKRISTNPENYKMAAQGVKLLIGNGVQLVQKLIAGSVPFLRLTGGEKANEPQESSLDQKLLQDGKGPSVPPTEEKKEEISDESVVVPTSQVDDSATSNTNAGILPDKEKKEETSEVQDPLIPSAPGPSGNPRGQQQLEFAEVAQTLGKALFGIPGEWLGRGIGRFVENVVKTSQRSAAQQNVNAGQQNVNAAQQNVNSGQQNVNAGQQNVNSKNYRSNRENNSNVFDNHDGVDEIHDGVDEIHDGVDEIKETSHLDPADLQDKQEGEISAVPPSLENKSADFLPSLENKSVEQVVGVTTLEERGEGSNLYDSYNQFS